MKAVLFFVLISASFCLASYIPVNPHWKPETQNKRDTDVCAQTNNLFFCSEAGGNCTALLACTQCLAIYQACKLAPCACLTNYTNCLAAAQNPMCSSLDAYNSCVENQPDCACGTPYTGFQYFGECANSYCDHDSNKCVLYKAPGVSCDNDFKCGNSTGDDYFTSIWYCHMNGSKNGYCDVQPSIFFPGDPCKVDTDCRLFGNYSLGCVSGVCASQTVGKVCPGPAGNKICGSGMYCKSNKCASYLSLGAACNGSDIACGPTAFCSASGVCTTYGTVGVGGNCLADSHCQDYLYCSGSGVCAVQPDKISCSSYSDCQNANPDYDDCYCNGTATGVCTVHFSYCNYQLNLVRQCMVDNGCPPEATTYAGGCMNQNCALEISCYSICQVETVGISHNNTACFGKANKALCPNPHPTTGTTGYYTSTTTSSTTGDGSTTTTSSTTGDSGSTTSDVTTGDSASTNSNQVSTTGVSGASSLMMYWTLLVFALVLLL